MFEHKNLNKCIKFVSNSSTSLCMYCSRMRAQYISAAGRGMESLITGCVNLE